MNEDELRALGDVAAGIASAIKAPAVPVSTVWPTFAMFALAERLRRGGSDDSIEQATEFAARCADALAREYQLRFLAPERAS